MATEKPIVSVICCAHNEEEYVNKSIPLILNALKGLSAEVLFIADRCTDNTVNIVKKFDVKIIEKKDKKWRNSYAEALQTGYQKAQGEHVSILDADIAVPPNFFTVLLSKINSDTASIAAGVVTYPNTFWNRLIYAWEKTYRLSPLGKEPRGATRVILKKALDEIGGFHDVPAPDTDLDIHLIKNGKKSIKIESIKAYHLRTLSLNKMVSGQVNSGRARYVLGINFKRTLSHSIIRIRPFVLQGWLLGWMNRKKISRTRRKN